MVLHGLAVLAWVASPRASAPHEPVLPLAVEGARPIVIDLPVAARPAPSRGAAEAAARQRLLKQPRQPETTRSRGPAPRDLAPAPAPSALQGAPPGRGVSRDSASPRIGPRLGGGQLWVRPLPLPPQELARRLRGTDERLADSLVTVAVQAFLDSIAADPNARPVTPPSWTKEIGGRTWGVDPRFIHLGGLKIPTAILALLPLSGGGNYDLERANRRLAEWRADLQQAAMRAANQEEFKRAIKEIRERKRAEEEFERNRRTPPSPPATSSSSSSPSEGGGSP